MQAPASLPPPARFGRACNGALVKQQAGPAQVRRHPASVAGIAAYAKEVRLTNHLRTLMYSTSLLCLAACRSESLSQPSMLPSAANAAAAICSHRRDWSTIGALAGAGGAGGTDDAPPAAVPAASAGFAAPSSAAPSAAAAGAASPAAASAAAAGPSSAAAGSATCTEKGVRGSGWPLQEMCRRQKPGSGAAQAGGEEDNQCERQQGERSPDLHSCRAGRHAAPARTQTFQRYAFRFRQALM